MKPGSVSTWFTGTGPGFFFLRLALATACAVTATSDATAQTQAGPHYSVLSLDYPDQTRHGLGAFVVYSPRPWLGIDVSTTLFAGDGIGGHAWQLLAGPRAGVTRGRVGIFAHVRPGLIRFSDRFLAPGVVCIAIFPPPEGCLARQTNAAVSVGGTVDVAVAPRALVRIDVGDSLTRYGRATDGARWTHALQVAAGGAWRF
jgi:hypothetical protein